MATVTGLTAERMLAIEAESIVGGTIVAGNLILTKHDGSTINAGPVVGPTGPAGPPNSGDLIGAIIAYGGSVAPTGWLMCDGASYARLDHPALFTAIGTAFGAADSLHFNVPDLRLRFPTGKTSGGTASTLGGSGGTKDAITVTHSHNHAHAIGSDGSHVHTIGGDNADKIAISFSPTSIHLAAGAGQDITYSHIDAAGDHAHGGGTGASAIPTGSDGTDQNLPPYVVVNYVIRRG